MPAGIIMVKRKHMITEGNSSNNNNEVTLPLTKKQTKIIEELNRIDEKRVKVAEKLRLEYKEKKQKKLTQELDRIDSKRMEVAEKLREEDRKERIKHIKNPKKYRKILENVRKEQAKVIRNEQNRGKGSILAGQILMLFGAMISIGGLFIGGGLATFFIGLFFSLIGIGLYKHGNDQQGRDTSIFFFGGGWR